MNKTVAGLVLIALLIGLGGGYLLGYVIYQPQLKNLLNSVDNLHDEMHDELQLRDDYMNGELEDLHDELQLRDDYMNGELEDLSNSILTSNADLNAVNSTLTQQLQEVRNLSGWLPAPAYDSGWSNWWNQDHITIYHGWNTTNLLFYALPETNTEQEIWCRIISPNVIEARRTAVNLSFTVRIFLWRIR